MGRSISEELPQKPLTLLATRDKNSTFAMSREAYHLIVFDKITKTGINRPCLR